MTGRGRPRMRVREAERIVFGSFVDCNMAEAWVGERLRIFPGKYGEDPVWGPARDLKYADGADAGEAFARRPDEFTEPAMPPNAPPGTPGLHGAVWFETVFQDPADPSGSRLYALYHNENYPPTLPFDPSTGEGYRDVDWPPGLGGDTTIQAVPRIGIMRSTDGGLSWDDRGILLEDRDDRMVRSPVNLNNTFPGGVGDPSAVACGEHLYVFFGEYAYPWTWDPATHDPAVEADAQCISVARVALEDLDSPTGRALRWDGSGFGAAWDGAGRPIAALQIPASDNGGAVSAGNRSFHWGPSVSWNEHLECWVMLMGRVDAGYWVGGTVWVSFNENADLGVGTASQEWSAPELVLDLPEHTLWYPSLQPMATAEDVAARRTTLRLGRQARLWVKTIPHADIPDRYASDHIVEFERE